MIAIGINDVLVCFLSAQRLSLSLFCVIPFANTSLISGNSSSVCCYFFAINYAPCVGIILHRGRFVYCPFLLGRV